MDRELFLDESGLSYLGTGNNGITHIKFEGVLKDSLAYLLIGSRTPERVYANTTVTIPAHGETICVRLQNTRSGVGLRVKVRNVAYFPDSGCEGHQSPEPENAKIVTANGFIKRKAYLEVLSFVNRNDPFTVLADRCIITGDVDITFIGVQITVNGIDALPTECVIHSPSSMTLNLTQDLWQEDIITLEYLTPTQT